MFCFSHCVVLLSLLLSAVESELLFASNSRVQQVSPNNFTSLIHNSPSLWIVNFYASWCGHCQHLAPIYDSFASDISAWKPVVGVAAVACSDPTNARLCRTYDVRGFPDVRLFPPNSATSVRGTILEGDKTQLMNGVLQYLTQLVANGQGHPSWPVLTFVRHPSDLRTDSADKRLVYIIVEDDVSINNQIGLMVILDLIPLRASVLVGRMRLADASLYGITSRGLFSSTLFNSMIPAESSFDRHSLVETIRSQVVGDRSDERLLASTVASAREQALGGSTPERPVPGLHMQDIESSLYYSLWIEVATRSSFDETSLDALKTHIDVLSKFLPGESHIMRFLNRTNTWLKSQVAPLTTAAWLNQITNTQTDDAYVASRLRWTWCKGSKPQFRGYPCSLWMTFHALTVNAYVQYLNNYSPSGLISSIRGYVEQFLSCRECASNFGRGSGRLLNSSSPAALRYLTYPDGPMLWLWFSHNRANEHLHGDITEDPLHPKVQFPLPQACPSCWVSPGTSVVPYNESAVAEFLVQYYGAAYIIDDDIHDPEEFSRQTTTVTVAYPRSQDSTVSSDNGQLQTTKRSTANCNVVSSEWTPCSRTCNVGTSMRMTNENADCHMEVQVRLCLLRPCVVQFPDWNRSIWHVTNCPKLGHTYRLARPQPMSLGGCTTVAGDNWRICGRCPPSASGRNVCCRPARSVSRLVDAQCRRQSPSGLADVRGQVLVEVIEYCICDENCSSDEI
jgi:thiol oxidase